MKYKFIIIPIITLIITQILKFIIEAIKNKKMDFSRLLNGNGGMPSSHTAFTTSLAFSVGIDSGFDSALFAVSLVFSIIVAYDAMGLRMESGKQAVQINLLMKNSHIDGTVPLKEMLGHKPLEVLAGFLFGVLSAFIQMNIFS